MKTNEEQLREEIAKSQPFTLVTASGDRCVSAATIISFCRLWRTKTASFSVTSSAADFFQVWSDGRHSRWIAFAAINIIESEAPTLK